MVMLCLNFKTFCCKVDLEYLKQLCELDEDHPLAPDKKKTKEKCLIIT